MRRTLFLFVLVLTVAGGAPSVYSKGSPDKIVITGGGLIRPMEINEQEALKGFNPWGGQFIDWAKGAIAAPSHQDQSYEVFFYMKWPGRHSSYDRGDLKLIYAVWYVPGRDGEPGYVYLPGKGEEFYGNNIGTIWREKDDGKWHQASPAWDALMNRRLTVKATAAQSFHVKPPLAIAAGLAVLLMAGFSFYAFAAVNRGLPGNMNTRRSRGLFRSLWRNQDV